MNPITLNLASRPFRNNMLAGSLLGVVGLGLLAATAANLYVYLSYGQSYAQLQLDQGQDRARITQLEGEEKRLAGEVRARDFRKVYERGKLASELIRKSAFSWTLLFNTLEPVVPPDIVMTAIRPNITSEGIVLRIEGVAKQHMALLSFEERLLRHPAFSKVFPSNERQLNPSLPDITFLLTCDYLPQRASAPEQVAEGGAAPASGETTAPGPGETPPDGAPVDAVSSASDAGGTAAATPGDASGPAAAPAAIAATFGRDGRAREARGARTVIAPGAILVAVASPASGHAGAGGRASGKTHAAAPAAAPRAGPTPPAAAPKTASAGAATATLAAASGAGAPGGPTNPAAAPTAGTTVSTAGAPPPGAVTAAPGAPPAASGAPPPAVTPGPPKTDPGDPRTAIQSVPGPHGAPRRMTMGLGAGQRRTATAPAQRLDVPMTFNDRPVAEIYDRMGQAYAVHFNLDPLVNGQAKLTINLQGRSLDDAVLLMGGMAGHTITRVESGLYKVSPAGKGAPLKDAPVKEEPLHPGGKP